jgi:hypothetical protein
MMMRMSICRNVCLLDPFKCKQREKKGMSVASWFHSMVVGKEHGEHEVVSMGVQRQRLQLELVLVL